MNADEGLAGSPTVRVFDGGAGSGFPGRHLIHEGGRTLPITLPATATRTLPDDHTHRTGTLDDRTPIAA